VASGGLIERTNNRVDAFRADHPRLRYLLPNTVAKLRQREQIDRYVTSTNLRCLRIGCGLHVDEGWLCTDFNVTVPGAVYLDATRPFPIPTATFDAVACEHMIEHIPLADAKKLLSECRRILRTGGTMRLSTPNIDTVRAIPDRLNEPDFADYVAWSNQTFGASDEQADAWNPVYALNRMMRSWGHTFLYDEPTLRNALLGAGFTSVIRVEPGRSDHPHLVGIDRHAELIGVAFDRIETMALEATA
jgi:predicted SAM-dependent methyltransferase